MRNRESQSSRADQIISALPLPPWEFRVLFIFAGANDPPGWDDVAHIC